MTSFRFPQPNERQNTSAIPVPAHTLRALLAAALAWEIDTNAAFPGLVPPQIGDATSATLAQLSDADAGAAAITAERLMQDRAEADQGA